MCVWPVLAYYILFIDDQGREEEVTKLFREVQQAYDTLMDPQERAWYDKHKGLDYIFRRDASFILII